ncbi:tobH protein [Rhodococcus sp. NPDC058521]|uniref:tobH protein n=1 Tax=Rhodococcus sp. NPDC058521 TaxID=3346536 RepID=UPI0036604B80
MTAPMPLLDLDDVDALVGADVDGILRSTAGGGAQIRATLSAVQEGALHRLDGLRPRCVVIVAGDGRAGRAASLVCSLVAARIGFPLVQAPNTPRWVGPLDVVVVAGDDAGDPRLAEAVDSALRRGAEVVVAAPDEGPLGAAAAGRAMVLEPRVAVGPGHDLLRYLAAYLVVLRALDVTHDRSLLPDAADLADAVDSEAVRDSPVNEVFHNPAKSLAARMQGRRIVLAGDGEGALEVARAGAEAVLHAGRVAAVGSLGDVLRASGVLAASAEGAVHADSIFHDPDLDGPAGVEPVRAFVVTFQATRPITERRLAGLPDGDLVATDVGREEDASRGVGTRDSSAAAPSEFEQAAVLVARFDMAAAYLRLTGGH